MLVTDLQALKENFVVMAKKKKTPRKTVKTSKRRVKKKCFKSPASSSTRQKLNAFGQFWQLEFTVILADSHQWGLCAAFERHFENLMQQHLQNSFTKSRRKCKKSTDLKDRTFLQVGKVRTANTLVVVQFVVRENTCLYFIFLSCALCVKVACKLSLSNSSQM